MNFPDDTPEWVKEMFGELDLKARRQLVIPKLELSSDRAAGYFAAISDLHDAIEAQARLEEGEKEFKRQEVTRRNSVA